MPCHAAMIAKPPSVKPDDTIESALSFMEKKNLAYVAVVDDEKRLVGLFSIRSLFKNILPVSINMSGGGTGMALRAAPGIAKRLKNMALHPVSEVMIRKVNAVYPDTPTWEGVNMIVQNGGPIMVVDPESGKLLGEINETSAFAEIKRLSA